jgi:hypothetical protein
LQKFQKRAFTRPSPSLPEAPQTRAGLGTFDIDTAAALKAARTDIDNNVETTPGTRDP